MDKNILNVFIQSIVAIVVLFTFTRFLGKKQIAQLSHFDYIVGITVGSISGNYSTFSDKSFFHFFIPITLFFIISLTISKFNLMSVKARKILSGSPTIIFQNGSFIMKNLKKSRLTINDVLEECRIKNIFNIADVENIIVESVGKVSVQLKAEKQPLTPSDMSIAVKYKGLAADLIIDGTVIHDHLLLTGHDISWLYRELKKLNILSVKDVSLAVLDSDGNLQVDKKNNGQKPYDVLE